MFRRVLVLLLLLTKPVCAQIYFQNPSFEADTFAPCEGCVPSGWYNCYNGQVSILDSTYSVIYPNTLNDWTPPDGQFFVGIAALDSISFGVNSQITIAQELSCPLRAATQYLFSIDLMSILTNYPGSFNYNGHSLLQIVLSNTACEFGQVVFESFDQDTSWHSIEITFTPDAEYSIIWFKQKPPFGDNYGASIDNLSPIYCLNYNEVQATTNDTSISVGACVTLNATPLGAYDSAYWKATDGTVVSTSLTGVVVCPTGYTEYVACTRSTDCGQFWSYDTVRVDIINGVPSTKPFSVSITPTVNCNPNDFELSTNQHCTLEIFDLTGKPVQSLRFATGKHNFKLNDLPNGVYICKLQSHQGVYTQRIVITNCN